VRLNVDKNTYQKLPFDGNIDGNPRYMAMFKEWRINPGLDEQIFNFTPPFGAKEVEIKKSVK